MLEVTAPLLLVITRAPEIVVPVSVAFVTVDGTTSRNRSFRASKLPSCQRSSGVVPYRVA